ncbi:Flagellin N-methylase [Roseimaritima multifibrata]|uniref:Flagellin N-methylase n=1 Tax=Roseimaritima multifibrata TaxID=1930274 RepID=A0A517MCX5_9BACT|nr:YkgJ family cysteine cluster protein [Roseimaritima multifibrata]QDS92743.1 Flagellin N-methylase [Roseimaritima multifibrata]
MTITKLRPGAGKPRRSQVPVGESLCEHCTAKCCQYFALPIDVPDSRRDFDFIRWYLLHDRASVFVDGGDWYLLVHTTCKHLQADNRCGIYETRPQICRDYTTDNCEYEDDWVYEKYFESPEQIAEYCDARFGPDSGQGFRSPRPTALPLA